VGDPHHRFPCVHIGGTNGKGSVAALVAEALAVFGWRVALYTSPHLVSIRERMVVAGRPISEAAFAAWADRIRPLLDPTGASFFEATTAIAFADFAARQADVAVVEVGLGGRLDATNVVTPLASAVTHVALDHTDYLGPTLEHVARDRLRDGWALAARRPRRCDAVRRDRGFGRGCADFPHQRRRQRTGARDRRGSEPYASTTRR